MRRLNQWLDRHFIVNVDKVIRALTIFMFALAMVTAMGIAYKGKSSDVRAAQQQRDAIAVKLTQLQSQQQRDAAVNACRLQLTAVLTDRSTDYQLAVGRLDASVGHLVNRLAMRADPAPGVKLYEAAATQVDITGAAFSAARDQRVEFEKQPTANCPVPLPMSALPPTSIIAPSPRSTTTTSTTAHHNVRHSTTVSPSTETSTPTDTDPPTPSTTAPPTVICEALPTGQIVCV